MGFLFCGCFKPRTEAPDPTLAQFGAFSGVEGASCTGPSRTSKNSINFKSSHKLSAAELGRSARDGTAFLLSNRSTVAVAAGPDSASSRTRSANFSPPSEAAFASATERSFHGSSVHSAVTSSVQGPSHAGSTASAQPALSALVQGRTSGSGLVVAHSRLANMSSSAAPFVSNPFEDGLPASTVSILSRSSAAASSSFAALRHSRHSPRSTSAAATASRPHAQAAAGEVQRLSSGSSFSGAGGAQQRGQQQHHQGDSHELMLLALQPEYAELLERSPSEVGTAAGGAGGQHPHHALSSGRATFGGGSPASAVLGSHHGSGLLQRSASASHTAPRRSSMNGILGGGGGAAVGPASAGPSRSMSMSRAAAAGPAPQQHRSSRRSSWLNPNLAAVQQLRSHSSAQVSQQLSGGRQPTANGSLSPDLDALQAARHSTGSIALRSPGSRSPITALPAAPASPAAAVAVAVAAAEPHGVMGSCGRDPEDVVTKLEVMGEQLLQLESVQIAMQVAAELGDPDAPVLPLGRLPSVSPISSGSKLQLKSAVGSFSASAGGVPSRMVAPAAAGLMLGQEPEAAGSWQQQLAQLHQQPDGGEGLQQLAIERSSFDSCFASDDEDDEEEGFDGDHGHSTEGAAHVATHHSSGSVHGMPPWMARELGSRGASHGSAPAGGLLGDAAAAAAAAAAEMDALRALGAAGASAAGSSKRQERLAAEALGWGLSRSMTQRRQPTAAPSAASSTGNINGALPATAAAAAAAAAVAAAADDGTVGSGALWERATPPSGGSGAPPSPSPRTSASGIPGGAGKAPAARSQSFVAAIKRRICPPSNDSGARGSGSGSAPGVPAVGPSSTPFVAPITPRAPGSGGITPISASSPAAHHHPEDASALSRPVAASPGRSPLLRTRSAASLLIQPTAVAVPGPSSPGHPHHHQHHHQHQLIPYGSSPSPTSQLLASPPWSPSQPHGHGSSLLASPASIKASSSHHHHHHSSSNAFGADAMACGSPASPMSLLLRASASSGGGAPAGAACPAALPLAAGGAPPARDDDELTALGFFGRGLAAERSSLGSLGPGMQRLGSLPVFSRISEVPSEVP